MTTMQVIQEYPRFTLLQVFIDGKPIYTTTKQKNASESRNKAIIARYEAESKMDDAEIVFQKQEKKDGPEKRKYNHTKFSELEPSKIEEIRTLYKTGISILDVSKVTGVSKYIAAKAINVKGGPKARKKAIKRYTDAHILKVRQLHSCGMKYEAISIETGIPKYTIKDIVKGRRYAEVKG